MKRTLIVFFALVLAGGSLVAYCRGSLKKPSSKVGPFHNFPTDPPNPFPVKVVEAFPHLSFKRPVYLTSPNDGSDRIFVVEQDGLIQIFQNQSESQSTSVFLDLSDLVSRGGNEEGLLGLAFDPGYSKNGFFYVYYSTDSPLRTEVARYKVSANPNVADPNSASILLKQKQPFTNHKGGMLTFGPDGMLYIGLGDGGSGGDPYKNGQNKKTFLAKILRINPHGGSPYSVPTDNPFVGERGTFPEIWAYGARNPWRFSFDRETGDLWLGDVGQDLYEEIDIVHKGDNLGWSVCEGFHRYNASGSCSNQFVAPIFEYPHSVGQCVIGGYVYRGTLLPSLRGSYVYGDNVSRQIWALVYDGQKVVSNIQIATLPLALSSFGEDQKGELYAVGFAEKDARIYRFEEDSTHPPSPPFPTKLSETGLFKDTSQLIADTGLVEYDVQVPLWSDGALKRRWILLPDKGKITFAATTPWTFPKGTLFVKHFEMKTGATVTRRLETRVLLSQSDGWHGYTYKWNSAQNDAELLAAAASESLTIHDSNGTHDIDWSYPSRTDCLRCHTPASEYVLGANTFQLNRAFGSGDNQISTWKQLGLFANDVQDPHQYESYPVMTDQSVPIEKRVRAYLAANCAQCHQPGGPPPTVIDLRYTTPLDQTKMVRQTPTQGDLGLPNAYIVSPGNKSSSVLWERMQRKDEKQMPPLATNVVHEEAVKLIGDWIDGLK